MSFFKRLLTRKPKRQTTRAQMDEALKRLVVPQLRALGFKGSMPHLRRLRGEEYDLLTFQFSQWGGSFCVEAARCRREGVDGPTGRIPGDKAKAWDLPHRYRVGPERVRTDYWYEFEDEDPDLVAERLLDELRGGRVWEIAAKLPLDWPEVDREAS